MDAMHLALLYDQLDDQSVQCRLCAHRCIIRNGRVGLCRVRENREGELYTHVYGNLISQAVDPIEKKPLYHFLPGSKAYSIATPGCNFRCEWCQNWQISQFPEGSQLSGLEVVPPKAIVTEAKRYGCESIAYTYTEPTIFFEYVRDVALIAQREGIQNILVTNGFMTPEMLALAEPLIDAANVDIKAFRDETYRRLMGGRLDPVLESCRWMKEAGIWLEITTLIIPGINDDAEELGALADFIVTELGPDTPWHLSRFYPQYRMKDRMPTNENILQEALAIGKAAGLDYIYLGNVGGVAETVCKQCRRPLIRRYGYATQVVDLNNQGQCKYCGTPLDGVFRAK